MKKELIGILICMFLISVAVAPVINAFTNEIDETKEPPQPAEWPPCNKCIRRGVGFYDDYEVRYEWDDDIQNHRTYYILTCIFAVCQAYDSIWQWHFYHSGEKVIIDNYIGFCNSNFFYIPFNKCKCY